MAAKRNIHVSSPSERPTLFPSLQPPSRIHHGSPRGRKHPMTDRVAIITGAGSGIGRATALNLLADGWSVALAGRLPGALEETAGLAKSGHPLAVPTDVTDPAQVDALFAKVQSTFGRVDV